MLGCETMGFAFDASTGGGSTGKTHVSSYRMFSFGLRIKTEGEDASRNLSTELDGKGEMQRKAKASLHQGGQPRHVPNRVPPTHPPAR